MEVPFTKAVASGNDFIIIDAVGVCESDKSDSKPLERKKGISIDKLLQDVALGKRDEDRISTLAGRLARIQQRMDMDQRIEFKEASDTLFSVLNNPFKPS